MFAKSFAYVAIALGLSSIVATTHAAIVITGTRVIYPSDQKTVAVQVKNEGAFPALMQTWVDNGDANLTPDEINVPFVITPPVSRLDSQVGQAIHISYMNGELPQDRESVFWLNVLDIPAKPKSATEDQASGAILQIAVRSRIKMFYRPAHLKDDAIHAAEKLKWRLNAQQLHVENPTPYYVNISSLNIKPQTGEEKSIMSEGLMLAPFEQKNVSIGNDKFKKFNVLSINDYGGLNNIEVDLNP